MDVEYMTDIDWNKIGKEYDEEMEKGGTKKYPYYMIHIKQKSIHDLYFSLVSYTNTAIVYFMKMEENNAFPLEKDGATWFVEGKDAYIFPFKTIKDAGEYADKIRKVYAMHGTNLNCDEIVTEPEDSDNSNKTISTKNVIDFKKAASKTKKKKES